MSLVWLNGELTDTATARIDPADRGFTLGDGLFETLRAEHGTPLHADQHFARLRQGAAVLGIAVPFTDTILFDALCALLPRHDPAPAALRLTLTRGPAPRGVLPAATGKPTVLITAGPLPAPLAPARAIVCASTRRNEFSPLSRIKSLNYLDSILARMAAQAAGADDALLLNTRGNLAEATAANIFVRIDGHWLTPPIPDGALPGIARARLLAQQWATEATIPRAALARADAALLSNSLSMRPLAAIDGRELDTKQEGSVLF